MATLAFTKRSDIRALSHDALDEKLRTLVADERHLELEFVLHLTEWDARRQYERRGFRSLWDYCRSLGLLEGATRSRVLAVRVLRKYPEAISYLRDAKVWISTLAMLEGTLTSDNVTKLLDEASGKSTREVEKLIAKLKSPVVEVAIVTPVEPIVVPVTTEEAALLSEAPIASTPVPPEVATPAPPSPTPTPTNLTSLFAVISPEARERVRPLSATQYDFHFTGDQETYDLYIELKEQTSNQGLADLMKRGLQALKRQVGKKIGTIPVRERQASEPRTYVLHNENEPRKARIPTWMSRLVFARDEGRCTYRLLNGDRCNSQHFCELDHITPEALGGKTEPSNLRVVCRAHHQRLADEKLGADFMERQRRKK